MGILARRTSATKKVSPPRWTCQTQTCSTTKLSTELRSHERITKNTRNTKDYQRKRTKKNRPAFLDHFVFQLRGVDTWLLPHFDACKCTPLLTCRRADRCTEAESNVADFQQSTPRFDSFCELSMQACHEEWIIVDKGAWHSLVGSLREQKHRAFFKGWTFEEFSYLTKEILRFK